MTDSPTPILLARSGVTQNALSAEGYATVKAASAQGEAPRVQNGRWARTTMRAKRRIKGGRTKAEEDGRLPQKIYAHAGPPIPSFAPGKND